MSLNRDFDIDHETYSVLVEFQPNAKKPVSARLDAVGAAVDGKAQLVFSQRAKTASSIHIPPPYHEVVAGGELNRFVEVAADSAAEAGEFAATLREKLSDDIVSALPVPPAEPAIAPASAESTNIEQATPDFHGLQGYLGPAPDGVDAAYAWQFPGGDGNGVRVVDVEGGWRFDHESLSFIRFNHWGGTPRPAPGWVEHGTAVASLLGSPATRRGIVGVCPGATVGVTSAFNESGGSQHIAQNILGLLHVLQPGDVVLMALQRPGPAEKFVTSEEQKGYIPVSYWGDVRAAMRILTASGITLVEVAGNGGQDLDDTALYDDLFDQKRHDTGGIMVGAGAPPVGQFGPTRARMPFSNYGSRLDCQAWGSMVVAAGYGDLWGETKQQSSYTGHFMGTSSAAPIVAGVIACLQGRHRRVFGAPVNPLVLRRLVASVGTPQGGSDPTSERIGPQPDLRALFQMLSLS